MSPAAHHMQQGSEDHGSQPDFKTAKPSRARSRSTETAAQLARVLEAMTRNPQTTDDLRALGIYQVSARIFGLRAMGWKIDTELFDGYSADGYSHARMARYTLIGRADEPVPKDDAQEQESEKRFATLAEQFEAAGCAFNRTKRKNAKAPYYVARQGWVRPVRNLEQAETILQQVQGEKS